MVEMDLRLFKPIHAAASALSDSGILKFSDAGGRDWHLIRTEDGQFNGVRLHLSLVCRVEGDPRAGIHINHLGGKIVCVIGQDGTVYDKGICDSLTVEHGTEGWLSIDLTYPSGTHVFALGLSMTNPTDHHYTGDGSITCEVRRLALEPLPFIANLGGDKLVFVDVGARYGLPSQWVWVGSKIQPVMFEPEPLSAEMLRGYVKNFPGGQLIEAGLSNKSGQRPLYVTREAACSSLLPPNPHYAGHYAAPQVFDVVSTEMIEVTSYLDLFKANRVPPPDVIKIDVQGLEYEVLEGFGDLLSDCLGVELETHISPLYYGQKLVTDIVALLDRFDFDLVELKRAGNFDRLMEFDAVFVKSPKWRARQSSRVQEKFAVLAEVWGLD